MDDGVQPGCLGARPAVELTREVDFAVFVFAQDDWTTKGGSPETGVGEASPRDNVVFEAGLFGGALGIRRTFILHANGAKLPSDLLGLTTIRYDPDTTPAIVRQINQKLRDAVTAEGRLHRIEGDWWQHSLTARTEREPSAVSLLTISRDRTGALEVAGRSWQADGTLSARYWSEAVREHADPAGIFYFWKGERPRHPDAPELEGPARSSSRASIARTVTSRLDPTGTTPFTRGQPASTSGPTRVIVPCWTAMTRRKGGADRAATRGVELVRKLLRSRRSLAPERASARSAAS